MLVEVVRRRLIERRRAELAEDIAAAREAYRHGDVRCGTVDDLMVELAQVEGAIGRYLGLRRWLRCPDSL